jgi:hypothetical protein
MDVKRHHHHQVQENVACPTPTKHGAVGRASWTLTADNERRLESFHHKLIRRILNINMFKAEAAERITNAKLRRKFDNIRNNFEFVNERQLNWLGHLLHLPDSRQTKKLVNAWVAHPGREEGQPQHLLRHSFRKALIAAGETNKDNKKAASDIHSLTLKEWRAQSKKGSRHGCWKRRDTKNDNAGCQKL